MRRLFLALALVLVLPLVARAEPPDELLGDGHFGRVRLGWEGHAPAPGLAPVTLLLSNPDPLEHVLRATVSVGAARFEETVALAPGASRRLPFVVPTIWDRPVNVTLSEDDRIVAASEQPFAMLPPGSALLVDGDASSRQVADVISGSVTFACAPEDLPGELGCIEGFQTIVLRHANPTRAGERVRGVLEDYARSGGTILVVPNADDRETRTLFEDQPAPATPVGPFLEKRTGLGRVLLAPGDPCASSPEGLALRRALALAIDPTPRRIFPRFFTGDATNEAAQHAGKLLGLFFGVYFICAGPLLARRLRGAPPRRVVRGVALLVVAFAGLAALMAEALRRRPSRIDAFTFVLVPEEGDALATTEVIVASGGAAHETLELEGEDVSATAAQRLGPFAATDPRISSSVLWTPAAVETRRAPGKHPVTFEDLAVPTLGDVRVMALARARDYAPLDLGVDVDPKTGGLVVRIHNTSGRDLGPLAVAETARRGEQALFRSSSGLRAGETLVAPVSSATVAGDPLHLVGFPSSLELLGADGLAPRDRDGTIPELILIAADDPPVRVRSTTSRVRERAWRIEPIPFRAAPALPGSVGLTVKPARQGVVVSRVAQLGGQRRIRGVSFGVGATILSVGGAPIRSQADLDAAFARVPADMFVEVVTTGARYEVQVSGVVPPVVTLKKSPMSGEGD